MLMTVSNARPLCCACLLTVLLTTTVSSALLEPTFHEDDPPRPSFLSRRAIDGTRGRKYFDPQKDGFFDDYGYDRGQDSDNAGKPDYSDLKYNVPGEPGIDYPAYLRIPRTSFSCYKRSTGYYADEDTGCQVFHVCDEGKVSSFLCPVGSLFSQRLLTCDWWNKVTCSSSEYYAQQQSSFIVDHDQGSIPTDVDDGIEGDPVAETRNIPPSSRVDQQSDNNRADPVLVVQNKRRNDNQLEVETKRPLKTQYSKVQQRKSSRNRVTSTTTVEPISVTAKIDDTTDSPLIRIQPTTAAERPPKKARGQSRYSSSGSPNDYYRRHPVYVSVQSTSTTPSTKTVTPKFASFSKAFDYYERTLSPATTTAYSNNEYQATTFASILNDEFRNGGLREEDIDEITPTEFSTHNFANEYDDMELKESIGIVNSHAQRLTSKTEKNSSMVNSKAEANSKSKLEKLGSFEESTLSVDTTTQSTDEVQTNANTILIQSATGKPRQLSNDERIIILQDVQNNFDTTTQRNDDTDEYYGDFTTLVPQSADSDKFNDRSDTMINLDSFKDRENGTKQIHGPVYVDPKEKLEESSTQSISDAIPSNHRRSDGFSDFLLGTTVSSKREGEKDITIVTPATNIAYFPDTVGGSSSVSFSAQKMEKNNSVPDNDDQSPLSAEPVGQLLLRYEDQPIYLRNFESARSAQVDGSIASPEQNDHQVRISLPGPGSYQNFRLYQDGKIKQPSRVRNLEPMSTPIPQYGQQGHNSGFPLINYLMKQVMNYRNHLSVASEPINHQNNPQEESLGSNDQHSIPPEQPVFLGHQNHEDESLKHHKFAKDMKAFVENHNHSPMAIRYNEQYYQNPESGVISPSDYQKNQEMADSHHRQHEYILGNPKNYEGQYGEVPDQKHFLTRYQTHQRPVDVADHDPHEQNGRATQHSQVPRDQYRNSDLQDYRNGPTPINFRPSHNHRDAYRLENQNGNQADDVGIVYAGNFGARIPNKNTQNKNVNVIKDNSKVTPDGADAYAINLGLEGNGVNLLWTMSQLTESTRQPRPFLQDRNKFRSHDAVLSYTTEATLNNGNPAQHDSFVQGPIDGNGNQYENSEGQGSSSGRNNFQYDSQDQYKVDVDDFAAPTFGVSGPSQQYPSQNVHPNIGNDAANLAHTYTREEHSSRGNGETSGRYGSIPVNLRKHPNTAENSGATLNTYQNGPQEVSNVDFEATSRDNQTPQGFNYHYNTDDRQQSHRNSWIRQQNNPIPAPPDPELNAPAFQSNQESVRNAQSQTSVTNDNSQNYDFGNVHSQSSPGEDNFSNFHDQTGDQNSQHPLKHSGNVIASYANYQNLEVKQTQVEDTNHQQLPQFSGKGALKYDRSSNHQNKIQNSQPLTDQRPFDQTSKNGSDARYPSKIKTTVETEFIPSLSFDFGSEQGQKEFLDALQRGLVSTDRQSPSTEKTSGVLTRLSPESEVHPRRTSKSDASQVIDNFKDTRDVMSGTA